MIRRSNHDCDHMSYQLVVWPTHNLFTSSQVVLDSWASCTVKAMCCRVMKKTTRLFRGIVLLGPNIISLTE